MNLTVPQSRPAHKPSKHVINRLFIMLTTDLWQEMHERESICSNLCARQGKKPILFKTVVIIIV